jgi:amino acid transporter
MSTTVPKKQMTVIQAAFIGVGSMVGAGIFALLGAAGAVAGSAVWVSFLIAGAIAGLQGYSFAKLGATYPSGGGMLAYLARGFGGGARYRDRFVVVLCDRRDRGGHGGVVLRGVCQRGPDRS